MEPVDDRLAIRLNRRRFVGASLALGGAVAAGPDMSVTCLRQPIVV